MRVLVVEDDKAIARMLEKGLRDENCLARIAYDGTTGLDLAADCQFDVIILDWMLQDMDGLDVSRQLRKDGNTTPILMLTARDAVPGVVKRLDTGTDDFLTKPFSFAELLARIRALGRRAEACPRLKRLAVADLTLDTDAHRVFRGKQEIHLTATEYRLLEFLMRRRGAASRRAIVEVVWGVGAEVKENTLDVLMRSLRNKVDAGNSVRLIRTVRGFGYRLQRRRRK